MLLEKKRDGNFKKNRKSDDSSDVWCEAIRSKSLDRPAVFRYVGVFR